MSNLIEGTFRARGTRDNLTRFLRKGLECIDDPGKVAFVEDDDDYFTASVHDYIYIRNTRRQWLVFEHEDGVYLVDSYSLKHEPEFVFAAPYAGAWDVDEDGFREIAKRYSIDIKVNGYERGAEFDAMIEVDRTGRIRSRRSCEYDDYIWECDMPLLGG